MNLSQFRGSENGQADDSSRVKLCSNGCSIVKKRIDPDDFFGTVNKIDYGSTRGQEKSYHCSGLSGFSKNGTGVKAVLVTKEATHSNMLVSSRGPLH